ncbi:MAG: hypothetical protein QOG66_1627 [Methylobacteriaceae bacterium]|nr:hypothetical protein [Methylobacteriaceae bacterium]
MSNAHAFAAPNNSLVYPTLCRIGVHDVRDALREGFDDFLNNPSHLVFLGLIYPTVGLCLAFWTSNLNLLPLLYPLISGFALIGPFAAIGIYETSRRREAGLDASWRHAFAVARSPSLPAIAALGVALTVIFLLWLMTASSLYQWLFAPLGAFAPQRFIADLFTTDRGRDLMLVGNVTGFTFAATAFCISAVSFPLLLDRHVGAGAAVFTSIHAVLDNPLPMLVWALIIAAGLAIGFVTLLVGLAVVVPVLGHATWHLYRKVVEPLPAETQARNPRGDVGHEK